jgi:hypothetical protein
MSVLASGQGPEAGPAHSQVASWQSLTTTRRQWVVSAFGVCAFFAGGVALFSQYDPERLWGVTAACGYALAALAALGWKSRGIDVALAAGLCGALLVPLAWMAWHGQGQPDVHVVARSAELLIRHGTPYQGRGVLASTTDPDAYDPYLPAMSFFALPLALAGRSPLGDPRVWFGVTFMVAFGAALSIAGAKDVARWSVFVACSPIIALELAVGGTDVPIAALLCLGFALLWARPRTFAAGLAFGAAAALKATAWPALALALILAATRDGKRAAAGLAATSLGVAAVLIGPFAVLRPDALVTNTILFPLGLVKVKSPAASPLPGYLIAQTGYAGHLLTISLLMAGALAIGISLIVKPLRAVPDAAVRLIIGLTLMIVLAPATRFGYFLYPGCILAWLVVSLLGRASRKVRAAEEPPPAGPEHRAPETWCPAP